MIKEEDWQGEEASAGQDGHTEQFCPGRKDDSGVVESFWHRERMVRNLGPRGRSGNATLRLR